MRILVGLVLLFTLTGCGAPAPERVTLNVFAAASLMGEFPALALEFEEQNPGVDVVLSFAGSSTLAAQITEGAPADVLATASLDTMVPNVDATIFATNRLVLAVPHGNPRNIRTVADLADPDLRVAVCAVEVPCGAAAAEALQGIDASIVDYEQDVRAVVSRIERGDVDAGLVYVTDVRDSVGDLDAVELQHPPMVEYLIAVLTDNPDARRFVEFVLSDRMQQSLRASGFGSP